MMLKKRKKLSGSERANRNDHNIFGAVRSSSIRVNPFRRNRRNGGFRAAKEPGIVPTLGLVGGIGEISYPLFATYLPGSTIRMAYIAYRVAKPDLELGG